MKSKAIFCAVALISLGAGSLASAQDRDWRGHPQQQQFDHRGSMHRDGRQFGDHAFEHRAQRPDRRAITRGQQFYRGDRLPTHYRERRHAMNNWRTQRLNTPAPDQQWVQVGSDYALIAIATGVIAQLVLNR